MPLQLNDTIAALASPPGPAGRGIIRVSGESIRDVLDGVFSPSDDGRWRACRHPTRHEGVFRLTRRPKRRVSVNTMPIPCSVQWWPTHRSYTGQPMAEFHAISSPPLLDAMLATLFDNHARPARPGEFTLRAFLAGRVDLVQAEAVLGVIDAGDEDELQTALEQLAGGLSGRIGQVRAALLDLLAELEAGLDFVDEDIQFVDNATLIRRLDESLVTLAELMEQAEERSETTGRRRVVLAGLPNAGKSTLFNALSGTGTAIVSETEGTTRDYLTAPIDCGGVAIDLVDTAGVDSHDVASSDWSDVMVEALRRQKEQLDRADLIVWCSATDGSLHQTELDDRYFNLQRMRHTSLLRVQTKSDVSNSRRGAVCVSAQTGAGRDDLMRAIGGCLTDSNATRSCFVGSTAARCRSSLNDALASLYLAHQNAVDAAGEELVAMELRECLEHLGQIVGLIYTDDILDRIFSKFCIGK